MPGNRHWRRRTAEISRNIVERRRLRAPFLFCARVCPSRCSLFCKGLNVLEPVLKMLTHRAVHVCEDAHDFHHEQIRSAHAPCNTCA